MTRLVHTEFTSQPYAHYGGFSASGQWRTGTWHIRPFSMEQRDILKFEAQEPGSRGYIAFSSYLDIPVVMGSRCTNMKSGIGGFKGRKLQAGDYMNFRIKRRYLPFFFFF